MTRFTVVWPQEIQNRLAELWIDSPHRDRVTWAAAEIDRLLTNDPFDRSVEYREGSRILIVPPLRILFVVREDDRIVEVGHISAV